MKDHGISDEITSKGYRLTPQRMMILEAIEGSDDHISAEDVYTRVRKVYPHINVSTVYRTLELLKELGMVTETRLGDGLVRYHSIKKGHHHHLVCNRCGRVIDLPEEALNPLKEKLKSGYGFETDLKHLAIFGICSECRGKEGG